VTEEIKRCEIGDDEVKRGVEIGDEEAKRGGVEIGDGRIKEA
jgi:hypothetical protein